ncbi:sigma-70 family RNA polymerase sigma factor [Agromyces sp. NPDC049794]|uniref:sigma-70 family RNA polymerase sigma factor n=1 Tax=Agromyces sp. NPDC049794 TaxID=3154362 RepID=UPI0033FA91EE
MTDRRILARRFETERPRLRAIATQLLGSAADADDAVQETWLRLERADAAGIDNLAAWLTTVVSRVSLDLLRAPRRTREHSWQVEPWRDEPVAEDADPADLVARSDRVSVALLVLLETLSPAERIALVLHDVFGQPFEEIAAVLDRSPEAARQLASRARRACVAPRSRCNPTGNAAGGSWTPGSPPPRTATSVRSSRCSTTARYCAPTSARRPSASRVHEPSPSRQCSPAGSRRTRRRSSSTADRASPR